MHPSRWNIFWTVYGGGWFFSSDLFRPRGRLERLPETRSSSPHTSANPIGRAPVHRAASRPKPEPLRQALGTPSSEHLDPPIGYDYTAGNGVRRVKSRRRSRPPGYDGDAPPTAGKACSALIGRMAAYPDGVHSRTAISTGAVCALLRTDE